MHQQLFQGGGQVPPLPCLRTPMKAEAAALDRQEWYRSVAHCVHIDAGSIKVKATVYTVNNNA